jgi:hypothetical protein
MFDRGDLESYRQQLSLVDWDSLLVRDDIDISTSNITCALIDAANTYIPNRVITKERQPSVVNKQHQTCYTSKE